MPLHLIKLSVGIDDNDHLMAVQDARRQQAQNMGLGDKLWHQTRHMPRRSAELLNGGSIYWVIKRFIRARQRIISIERQTNEEGRAFCAIHLDTELVPVIPRRQKSFQGWRYYKDEETPRDIEHSGVNNFEDVPPDMVQDLKDLCLI